MCDPRNKNHHDGQKGRRRSAAIVLAVGLFLLPACAGCGPGDSPATTTSRHVAGPGPLAEGTPPSPGILLSPGAQDKRAAPEGYSAQADTAGPQAPQVATTQSLTVQTPDLQKAKQEALNITSNSGGAVQQQDERDATDTSPGNIVLALRLPADRFEVAVSRLRGLGEVKSFTSQSANVTQQVIDLGAELDGVRQTIARLQQLQAQTSAVSTLIEIQQQLTWENSRLLELGRQQQGLDKRVETVTITVTLLGEKPAPPVRNWVSAGLHSGWSDLNATAKWLVTWASWLAVWAIPAAAVLVLAGKAFGGRRRKA